MKKMYLKCLSVFLLTFLTITAFAQKTITGTVMEASGPIPGVSVTIKGTTKATQTDAGGKFSISATEGNILVFRSVGYISKEINVGASSTVNVRLESSSNSLDEVQVTTAFGIKKEKRSLGYSTQEVAGKDLIIGQAPTIAQGLMGKVAGLQISQSGGGVEGGSSRIVVRGNTSLTGDNRALIIVDGVALNNDPANVNGNNTASVAGSTGGDVSSNNDWGTGMNFINQDDIESITVLKGPAAAALYGARGGNGVILITRKKGSNRPGLGVDYNYSYRHTNPYEIQNFQNEYGQGGVASMLTADNNKMFPTNGAGQRYQIGNSYTSPGEYLSNSFGTVPYPMGKATDAYFSYPGSQSWGPRFDNLPILNYDGILRPYSAQPDNWKAFFPDGSVVSHNVAISGGSESATGRLSYTRNDTKANILNSNMQSNTFNLGSTLKVSKKLSAEVTASYINFTRLNAPAVGSGYLGGVIYSMPRDYNPYVDFDNTYGPNNSRKDVLTSSNFPAGSPAYPFSGGYLGNQYWNANNNNTVFNRNGLTGGMKLMADLTDFLNVTAQGGVDNSNDVTTVKNQPTDVLGQANGAYKLAQAKNLSTNLQAFARLHKDNLFGKEINASLTAGVERYYRNDYTSSNSTAGNFVKPNVFALNNGANPVPQPQETKYAKQINSAFSFLNLSYKNYLFLEATARNDWSSTLANGSNSYFYPAANLSYVFTDGIKGMQNSLPWLSFGKLKLSYAETGSDTEPYSIFNVLDVTTNNGQQAQSLPGTLKFDGVKPQRSRSYEGGLSLGFLKNRLNVDLTAYSMKTFNQILGNPLAQSSGFSNILINTGSLGNTGFEFIVSGSPIKTKDFSWDVSISGSHARTKVLALQDGVETLTLGNFFGGAGISQKVKVGDYYGTLYGRDFTYINGQKVVARAQGTDLLPLKYTVDGKSYYAGTQWVLSNGEVPIGNSQPSLTGGITNTFKYKAFSLYVLADAKIGGDTYFGSYAAGMGSGNLEETLKERNGGGLPLVYPDGTIANTGVNFGGVFADGTPNTDVVNYQWYYQGTFSAWNHLGVPRSAAVFKNSWMKLREVALTYQVPAKFIQKTKFIQNLSLSLVGRDLFYIFTTIPKGLNPEGVNSIGNMQGIEYDSLPKTRSFGFTIRSSF
ncbi:SusC/RagA family TonB-linked outer membrane protein [Pedobacter borealis]|uniref:SusC/RagA family TonB-linked outer membrane protein n=1 Tax=Pedobacter borealis TaxID=475254 RepID=UPI000689F1F8|nr:SusC/RagA family TonB-linked outer membrane protein [Pedobacter borealis]